MASSRSLFTACLVCLLMLVFCAGASVSAKNYYMKRASHTDAFSMGGQTKSAQDDTTEVWLSDGAAFMKTSDTKVLVLPEKSTMYVINDADKSYFEIPVASLGATKEAIDAMPENPMAAMMGDIKVSVTPTDETKTIGKWDAKRYDLKLTMAMGTSVSQYWATTDIDVDADMFMTMATVTMSMFPGYQDIVSEFEKMEGIPVETNTTVNMMGATITSWDKMLELAEKDAPEGMFKLPEGYTKTTMHPLMGQQ